MIEIINKLIAPVKRRVMNMVARAVIESVKDSSKLQQMKLKILADETIDRLDRVQNYGFTSVPKSGAEAVVLFLGGDRSHGVIIAADDRDNRLKNLSEGDAAIYTASGAKAVLKEATKNFEIELNKIKIQNNSNELITVLIEFIDAVIVSNNITAIGPQPMMPADIAAMQVIKAKLQTFKV